MWISKSLKLVQNIPKSKHRRPFCYGSRSQMKQFSSEPLMAAWRCLQHVPFVDHFPSDIGRIAGHSPAQFSPSSSPPPLRLRIRVALGGIQFHCKNGHWLNWYLVSCLISSNNISHWINLNRLNMLKTTNYPRSLWCGLVFLTHPQNCVHHMGLSQFTLLFTSNQLVNPTGCSFREPNVGNHSETSGWLSASTDICHADDSWLYPVWSYQCSYATFHDVIPWLPWLFHDDPTFIFQHWLPSRTPPYL